MADPRQKPIRKQKNGKHTDFEPVVLQDAARQIIPKQTDANNTESQIEKSKIAQDPLASFIKGILGKIIRDRDEKYKPVAFGIIILLLDIVVDFGMVLYFKETDAFFKDSTALLTDFVMNPIICGIYLWISSWSDKLFDNFRHTGSVYKFIKDVEDKNSIEKICNKRIEAFKKKSVSVIILLIAIGNACLQIATYYKKTNVYNTGDSFLYAQNGMMSLFRVPFWILVLYALIYVLYYTAVSSIYIYVLFHGKTQDIKNNDRRVKLQLLNPDGCGGLRDLSEYLSFGVLAMLPIGAYISLTIVDAIKNNTLATSFGLWVGLIAYVVIAPTLLFVPLYTVHRAMVTSKKIDLGRIAKRYDDLYDQILQKLTIGDEDSTQVDKRESPTPAEIQKLELLKQLYLTVKNDYPDWPLNFQIISRVAATAVAILIPLLQLPFDRIFMIL